MKCANCGAAELEHGTRDIPYVYKGVPTTFAGVTGDFCPACGEQFLDGEQADRVSKLMLAFNKSVNRGAYDPAFILKVRRDLGLDQKEAGEIFGGGKNAFSRYETGDTAPPTALVKLLKVLDKHPELLDEVRAY